MSQFSSEELIDVAAFLVAAGAGLGVSDEGMERLHFILGRVGEEMNKLHVERMT